MIYFIQQGKDGPVKIGYTTDVEKRLAGLQSATPGRLYLLGTMRGSTDKEADLHSLFIGCRINGEWFEPTQALYGYIFTHCIQKQDSKHRPELAEDAKDVLKHMNTADLFFLSHWLEVTIEERKEKDSKVVTPLLL